LGNKKKLLEKARNNPKNLRFEEFCNLIEQYELINRGGSGSHVVYKRICNPNFSIPIQNKDGKAIPYQIKQFIGLLEKHNLLEKEGDGDGDGDE
jgi:hypothetical protein